eukprot:15771571-Heterocapsa_arctica.AAC.1
MRAPLLLPLPHAASLGPCAPACALHRSAPAGTCRAPSVPAAATCLIKVSGAAPWYGHSLVISLSLVIRCPDSAFYYAPCRPCDGYGPVTPQSWVIAFSDSGIRHGSAPH